MLYEVITEGRLAKRSKPPHFVARPETEVLTRGYDPSLSVGSARPAVFRSSTYVFSSPESAERALREAMAIRPGDAAPLLALARLFAAAGHWSEAADARVDVV